MWFLFLKCCFSGVSVKSLRYLQFLLTPNSDSLGPGICWNLFPVLSDFQLLPLTGLPGFSSHGWEFRGQPSMTPTFLGFLHSIFSSSNSSRFHFLILLPIKTTAFYESFPPAPTGTLNRWKMGKHGPHSVCFPAFVSLTMPSNSVFQNTFFWVDNCQQEHWFTISYSLVTRSSYCKNYLNIVIIYHFIDVWGRREMLMIVPNFLLREATPSWSCDPILEFCIDQTPLIILY